MRSKRTLLAPGNEATWTSINREQDRELRSSAREATVAQRIERGLELSLLAHDIRVGVRDSRDRRA